MTSNGNSTRDDSDPRTRLMTEATGYYLRARLDHAFGRAAAAGLGYTFATQRWIDAARVFELTDPEQSLRQELNAVVAMLEGGDVGQAQALTDQAAQHVELRRLDRRTRTRLRTGIRELRKRIRAAMPVFRREVLAHLSRDRRQSVERVTAERLAAKFPAVPQVHALASQACHEQHDFEAALSYLDTVIQMEPRDTRARGLRVLVATEAGTAQAADIESTFDGFGRMSATLAYLCGWSRFQMASATGSLDRRSLAWVAAACDRAVDLRPNDMTLDMWGRACVLRQYCRWKLGTPGARSPAGPQIYARTGDLVEVAISLPARDESAAVARQTDPTPELLRAA